MEYSEISRKIAILTLAIYFTPTVTALIPIAGAAKALKVSFIAFASLKNTFLIFNIESIYGAWNSSNKAWMDLIKLLNLKWKAFLSDFVDVRLLSKLKPLVAPLPFPEKRNPLQPNCKRL